VNAPAAIAGVSYTKKKPILIWISFIWWTCAELNCGLTRFLRGYYTLSLRLNLALGKSVDDLLLGHVSLNSF